MEILLANAEDTEKIDTEKTFATFLLSSLEFFLAFLMLPTFSCFSVF